MFFAENRHGAREVRDLLFAAGFLLVFAVLICPRTRPRHGGDPRAIFLGIGVCRRSANQVPGVADLLALVPPPWRGRSR